MINYGRGLCNLISQVGRAFYFLVSHSLSVWNRPPLYNSRLARGLCPAPTTQLAPHPARHGLTFQRKALLVSGSSLSLGLNFPALLLRSRGTHPPTRLHLSPSCGPYPSPAVEGGERPASP